MASARDGDKTANESLDEDELRAGGNANRDDELDDELDDEESEERAAADADTVEGEAVADSPRNRAERRLAARQKKRGLVGESPMTLAEEQAAASIGRTRLPPRTQSGKSSADEVPPWARGIADSLNRNKTMLVAGAVVIIGVAASSVGWTLNREAKRAEAANVYHEGLDISSSPIRPADAPPDPPGTPRPAHTYTDAPARSRAALEAFRRVNSQFSGSPVAPLARLSEAATLYDLGRYAEAKPIFESLIGADVAGQEGRVLEGLGFTLEALNDLPGALRRYQELQRVQDGAHRDAAVFHQARILHRQNEATRAKDLLHGLLERLNRVRPDDPASSPGGQGSIFEEAQALLRDIDPADPLGRPHTPTQDPSEIIRMLQQRGAGARMRPGGPPGGAPPGGEAPPGGGGH